MQAHPVSSRKIKLTSSQQFDQLPLVSDPQGATKKFTRIAIPDDQKEHQQLSRPHSRQFQYQPTSSNNLTLKINLNNNNHGNHASSNSPSFLTHIDIGSPYTPQQNLADFTPQSKDAPNAQQTKGNQLRLLLSSDSQLGQTSKNIFFPKMKKDSHKRISSQTISSFGFSSQSLKLNSPDIVKSSNQLHRRFFAKKIDESSPNSPSLALSPLSMKQRKEKFFGEMKKQDQQMESNFKLKLNVLQTPLQSNRSTNQRFSMTSSDLWLPGKKGIDTQFRLLHKNIDKVEDKQRFLQAANNTQESLTPTSSHSTFLLDFVSTMNRIAIPPKKMNFLKENQNCTVLDVSNSHLTTTQSAEFFSEIIRNDPYQTHLLSLTADNNKITDDILLNHILKHLPIKLEVLILRHNLISNSGIAGIAQKLSSNHTSQTNIIYKQLGGIDIEQFNYHFDNKLINLSILTCKMLFLIIYNSPVQQQRRISSSFLNQRLITVDLENNKIRDIGAIHLFKGLKHNLTLTKLNLSQNMIGDISALDLRELIETSMSLQELYLKWNNFRSEGGLLIAQGLRKNQSLRVLDISYNSIGSISATPSKRLLSSDPHSNQSIGQCLSEVLQSNKKLIHLDISSCGLTPQDLTQIQNGLLRNHTLYGLHISGNLPIPGKGAFCVDSSGFLVIREQLSFSEEASAFSHSIQGVQHTIKNQSYQSNRDHCWLCEGWELLEFSYDDSNNTQLKVKGPLFIHLDFDEYRGHRMQNTLGSRYVLRTMCPPNTQVKYFITEPGQQQILLDEVVPQLNLNKPVDIDVAYISELGGTDTESVTLGISSFNVIQTLQQNVFSTEYYQTVEVSIREHEPTSSP